MPISPPVEQKLAHLDARYGHEQVARREQFVSGFGRAIYAAIARISCAPTARIVETEPAPRRPSTEGRMFRQFHRQPAPVLGRVHAGFLAAHEAGLSVGRQRIALVVVVWSVADSSPAGLPSTPTIRTRQAERRSRSVQVARSSPRARRDAHRARPHPGPARSRRARRSRRRGAGDPFRKGRPRPQGRQCSARSRSTTAAPRSQQAQALVAQTLKEIRRRHRAGQAGLPLQDAAGAIGRSGARRPRRPANAPTNIELAQYADPGAVRRHRRRPLRQRRRLHARRRQMRDA